MPHLGNTRNPVDVAAKLAFHDADTDTDILARSSRDCRRVGQFAIGITSIARVGRVGEDPREDVGVGAVECELHHTHTHIHTHRDIVTVHQYQHGA